MRIGLDAHILGKGKGGVERVVHQMVRLLPELLPRSEFVIFTKKHCVLPFGHRRNVRYVRLPVSDPLLQRSIVLPWLARREKLDLLHVQRAAPPCTKAKLILHTHDLLPLTAPADHRGLRDRLVRRLTPISLRKADCVLTVSQSVAREIRALFPRVAPRVAAVLNGIEGGLFQPKLPDAVRPEIHTRLGVDGEYVLYLGALMARKNLEVSLRAFGQLLIRLRSENRPVPKLVLAGMSRSAEFVKQLRAIATEIGPEGVCFTGFVSDEECVALLQHATMFLAPSRGEGFDLPALEAMACAVPVVCSDIEVHRELLGSDAVFFRTDSASDLARQLHRLFTEKALAIDLARRGPLRAARFTWESAMEQLAQLYTDIFAGRSVAVSNP
jgi:glycosyltransferase involved in cell wall biosynthesis